MQPEPLVADDRLDVVRKAIHFQWFQVVVQMLGLGLIVSASAWPQCWTFSSWGRAPVMRDSDGTEAYSISRTNRSVATDAPRHHAAVTSTASMQVALHPNIIRIPRLCSAQQTTSRYRMRISDSQRHRRWFSELKKTEERKASIRHVSARHFGEAALANCLRSCVFLVERCTVERTSRERSACSE
jgi:hypothetical protein